MNGHRIDYEMKNEDKPTVERPARLALSKGIVREQAGMATDEAAFNAEPRPLEVFPHFAPALPLECRLSVESIRSRADTSRLLANILHRPPSTIGYQRIRQDLGCA